MISLLIAFILLGSHDVDQSKSIDPKDIIRKSDELVRGETSRGEMVMTIIRPSWQREVQFKSWSKGDKYGVILITSPARDKGTAFLKRDREIWNWQPSIDRTIKLPPSMMLQSWMGSDFTNDDLVKNSSVVEDFHHVLLGEETIEGRACYKIQLTPKEDAAVVWGQIISWIDKTDYIQMKAEFYDEEEYLINTMYGKEIESLGGKNLPTVLEVIPEDADGQRTLIRYKSLFFDEELSDAFFSMRNIKKLK